MPHNGLYFKPIFLAARIQESGMLFAAIVNSTIAKYIQKEIES